MSFVSAFKFLTGRPCGFLRVDLVTRAGHIRRPFHRVENEELGFGTEESRVAQAGRFEIRLAALRNGARVAVIAFSYPFENPNFVFFMESVAENHRKTANILP